MQRWSCYSKNYTISLGRGLRRRMSPGPPEGYQSLTPTFSDCLKTASRADFSDPAARFHRLILSVSDA